jgi:hypothetical protein
MHARRCATWLYVVLAIAIGAVVYITTDHVDHEVEENRKIFLQFVADERCIDARFTATIYGRPDPDCHTHHLRDYEP